MPVYPGDPGVVVKHEHTLAAEGWNLRTVTINTHAGTHVNVPSHMIEGGASLDDIDLTRFIGKATIYKKGMDFQKDTGVIFVGVNIDQEIAEALIASPPKFIGLSDVFDFDVELERKLLNAGIISYENLTNVDALPEEFQFHGVPLAIREGDGSPVRAYAITRERPERYRETVKEIVEENKGRLGSARAARQIGHSHFD